MSYATWNNSPWWRRCEILHSLGMSWREMALLCEVKTSTLRLAVKTRQDAEWMTRLETIPLPQHTAKEELQPRETWIPEAGCRSGDITWFIPQVGTPIDMRARACCASCEVSQQCLDEVLQAIDDCTYRAFTTPRVRRGYRQCFGIECESGQTGDQDDAEDGGDS